MREGLPQHILIIPDGNRRYAERHGLLPREGHRQGTKKFREISRAAFQAGIPYFTFWAASEANLLKRSKIEVGYLLSLLREELGDDELKNELVENEVRFRVLGRWSEMIGDASLESRIGKLELKTAGFKKHALTILLAYDGKREMLEAVRKIREEERGPVDFQTVKEYLWTSELPPVDLVIRTGEEDPNWAHLSSGIMMWDTVDAQFYSPKTLWPDFSREEFSRALEDYKNRRKKLGS